MFRACHPIGSAEAGSPYKMFTAGAFLPALLLLIGTVFAPGRPAYGADRGGALFKEHCSVCHPDGGNSINPKKTLKKKDLGANGVRTAADIIKLIRHPGPGMVAFDTKTISDHDAGELAEYVLKTYGK